MSKQHSVRYGLTGLLTGSLVAFSSLAYADDAEATPTAPENVQTPSVDPTTSRQFPSGEARFIEGPAESSANEPTFKSESKRQDWPNVPMLSTGATIFGLSYLPAVIGGALADDAPNRKDLYIPVAGPWMMLSHGPEESKGEKALLISDGILQGVGSLMMLTSFFIPEEKTESWYLIGKNDVQLSPRTFGTGYGLGASGRF